MILIAGPCVIESRDNLLRIAEGLATVAEQKNLTFYFKASFDKANRTSLESFRGPGLQEGLKLLEEVKTSFGYRILTDIHESSQAAPAVEVADVLQIPAFLCRQTDLLVAAAQTPAVVNIKKGQFMVPSDMRYSVLKVLKTRGYERVDYETSLKAGVWLTERGSTFGYGNLVVDMRSLAIMRQFAPVVFDATHSVQMPGQNGKTGGDRRFVPILARAAAAAGVDGFFFETHFDPDSALSDGPNMIRLEDLPPLVDQLAQIGEIVA
ncbi:MAG: 3-deoxy-8-phosphooctulonate synthase [Epsilonproteobacteria bacterium]|nr:3-deoxy-8-phosphooctulonate synthase [Campylobacterota bacterium]